MDIKESTTTPTISTHAPAAARITGSDLSDDVWRIIAFYINLTPAFRGLPSIFKFISLNRTFLDVVLSIKYRDIRWIALASLFFKMLERLQDPFIARYVKRLSIRAWFIDLLFKNNTILKFSPPKVQPGVTGIYYVDGMLDKLCIAMSEPLPVNPWPTGIQKISNTGEFLQGLSSSTIFSMLINAINKMTGVIVLDFDWRDLPSNPPTAIFLASMRKAFSSTLRRLMLKAQMPKFKEFLEITNFENLDELEFYFDYQSPSPDTTSPSDGGNRPNSRSPGIDTSIQELQNDILPFIHTQQGNYALLSYLPLRQWT